MLVWGSGWFRSPKHAPKLIRNVGHNFKRPMAESLALHCRASEVIFRNGPRSLWEGDRPQPPSGVQIAVG